MLTIGDTFPQFQATAVIGDEPGKQFTDISEKSYDGKWKVFFF